MPQTTGGPVRRRRLTGAIVVAVAVALVAVAVGAFVRESVAPAEAVASVAEPTPSTSPAPAPPALAVIVEPPAKLVASTAPLTLQCPTTMKPGCALSFIKNDAGWRIHPVYGYHSCHTGVDLRGRYGSAIHAAADGTVIRVIHGDPAYGNVTLIQHRDHIRTMYAHQSSIGVKVGQKVTAGEKIGEVGATGFATGPHLHFEVHVDRVPYDPDGWFGAKTKHPVGCFTGTKF